MIITKIDLHSVALTEYGTEPRMTCEAEMEKYERIAPEKVFETVKKCKGCYKLDYSWGNSIIVLKGIAEWEDIKLATFVTSTNCLSIKYHAEKIKHSDDAKRNSEALYLKDLIEKFYVCRPLQGTPDNRYFQILRKKDGKD